MYVLEKEKKSLYAEGEGRKEAHSGMCLAGSAEQIQVQRRPSGVIRFCRSLVARLIPASPKNWASEG